MANIIGTNGNDNLNDTSGDDIIEGLAGNDTITVTAGSDTIFGGDGDDILVYKNGSFKYYPGLGLDTLDLRQSTFGLNVFVFRDEPGSEIWLGTDYADSFDLVQAGRPDALSGYTLRPGAGNDTVRASAFNDQITGGTGSDDLTGGAGDDIYFWSIGDGNDTLDNAGGGLDILRFGTGISVGDIRLEVGSANLQLLHVPSGARLVLENQHGGQASALELLEFANGARIDLRTGYNYQGTSGNDTLYGGAFDDTIAGLAGDDRIYGRGGDDRLDGGDGVDTLEGEGGADFLIGGIGNDILRGGTGDDQLVGGAGNDTMDGGDGAGDWAWYFGESQSVTVNLANQTASGSSIGTDTLSGIENAHGGDAADTITGSTAANTINAGGGADTVNGGDGNDSLLGGAGDDTVNGGNGNDFLYGDEPFAPNQTTTNTGTASAGQPLAISLTGARSDPDGSTSVFGYVGSQVPGQGKINIVYVIDVSGSMADQFVGDETVPDLNGDGSSNTLLDGAIAGFTALNASLINAGLADAANVSLVIFDDASSIVYTGTPGRDSNINGVPDLVEELRGLSDGDSTYYDLGLANAAYALQGFPAGANYVFFMSDGAPNGGAYDDEVEVLLNTYHAQIRAIGLGDGASLPALDLVDDGIENESAERVLTPSQLRAGLVASTIDPALIARVDISLNGQVVKSIPASQLVSTPFGLQFNADLTGLSTSASDVVRATVVTVGNPSVSLGTQITITQIENTAGGADILHGNDGDDVIDGNAGNDQLFGDAGNDSIIGGLGNDTMDGGSGLDTADYSEQFNAVTVNLANGTASGTSIGSDTLVSIERAIGGFGNDTLIAANVATPSAPDVIKTSAMDIGTTAKALSLANDFDLVANGDIANSTTVPHATIRATGSDAVDFYKLTVAANTTVTLDIDGADFDTVVALVDAAGATITSNDDAGGDPGSSSSRDSNVSYTFTTAGTYYVKVQRYSSGNIGTSDQYTLHISQQNAPLTTQTEGSELLGGGGDDILVSGRSADRLSGGGGTDTASFENATRSVIASLASGTASGDGADRLTGIENLTGSAFADTLTGDSVVNVLKGGDGGDTLVGAAGNDTLHGDGGNDILDGGADTDSLRGGAGNDQLDGGTGVDTAVFSGARSAYTITQTSPGVFTVTGADGTDSLRNVEYAQFDNQTVRLYPGTGTNVNFATDNPASYMGAIRDFDGNDLGGAAGWRLIGAADANGDGDIDRFFVNQANGRFAEVGTAPDGMVYFSDYGWAGETRVVGIYVDPLVQSGQVQAGGPFDSQRRFQNDLQIGNIAKVLGAGDYDRNGLQEVYFSLSDKTAYLHAYMHADGNIQYANYQSQQQVIDYLTQNGWQASTYVGWFA